MPQLRHNFLSISKLDDEGYKFEIHNKTAKVYKEQKLIITGKRDLFGSKLHWITPDQRKPSKENINSLLNKEPKHTPSCETIHGRFGHVSMRTIYRSAQVIDGVKPRKEWLQHGKMHDCETCKLSRMTRRSFKTTRDQNSLPTRPLERVYSDLKTGLRRSVRGFRHWIIIVDGYSRYIWGKTLRRKSDAFNAIKEYIAWAKANKTATIVKFITDFGGEFEDHRTQELMKSEGITWSPTAPRSQSSNGIAEIQMKFITLAIISMCKHSNKSTSFWCYAFDLVIIIRNAILNSGSMRPDISPHEAFFGRKPNVEHLKPFMCIGYMHIDKEMRELGGFGDRAQRCRFIGLDSMHGVFKVLLQNNRVARTTHVTFYETMFQFPDESIEATFPGGEFEGNDSLFDTVPTPTDVKERTANEEKRADARTQEPQPATQEPMANQQDTDTKHTQPDVHVAPPPDDTPPDEPPPESEPSEPAGVTYETEDQIEPEPPLRRSTRDRTYSRARWAATDLADDPRQAKIMKIEIIQELCMTVQEGLMLNETLEITYEQATTGPDAEKWNTAVKEHLNSHDKNGTWELVPMGDRTKKELVTNKYVFVKKKDKNGNVKRWKARMVARGFSQIKGLNYKETFSPTVKPTTVRWLLSLMAARRMKGVSFDVSDAYLKATLDEEIYMEVPKGLPNWRELRKTMCCKLIKGLFGLKQSGRVWNAEFTTFLISIGYNQTRSDPCLFIKTVQMSEKRFLIFLA
ncbi:MAG: reverse transcriptase domain-containing protein, partial [Flavobacteriales bacterium]